MDKAGVVSGIGCSKGREGGGTQYPFTSFIENSLHSKIERPLVLIRSADFQMELRVFKVFFSAPLRFYSKCLSLLTLL